MSSRAGPNIHGALDCVADGAAVEEVVTSTTAEVEDTDEDRGFEEDADKEDVSSDKNVGNGEEEGSDADSNAADEEGRGSEEGEDNEEGEFKEDTDAADGESDENLLETEVDAGTPRDTLSGDDEEEEE
ncbi:hypothetical protein S7711_01446 [Stachybotrys chartarum IBT 7711]|uniref:Uncharacterized protein n=1 Tax=Stachybotrys chartarum (strain CBS 109288 / IBT 7711) TaxID=1280523 RepID=A0A084B703_STACB|nr:hypothetical protein S7711_01446 [Stachybotrys chartarum IBT 7711]